MLSFPKTDRAYPPYVELSLKTSPPVAVLGSEVYAITRVELLTAANQILHSVQPDDARMHDTVCGFNSINHVGNTLYFRFDPDSPLTLFGFQEVAKLVLHLGIRPLSHQRIARIATHNAHRVERTCAICLVTDCEENWTELDCNHAFHTHCIRRWLYAKSTCPMCRMEIL